jgi:hypothetical protein
MLGARGRSRQEDGAGGAPGGRGRGRDTGRGGGRASGREAAGGRASGRGQQGQRGQQHPGQERSGGRRPASNTLHYYASGSFKLAGNQHEMARFVQQAWALLTEQDADRAVELLGDPGKLSLQCIDEIARSAFDLQVPPRVQGGVGKRPLNWRVQGGEREELPPPAPLEPSGPCLQCQSSPAAPVCCLLVAGASWSAQSFGSNCSVHTDGLLQ